MFEFLKRVKRFSKGKGVPKPARVGGGRNAGQNPIGNVYASPRFDKMYDVPATHSNAIVLHVENAMRSARIEDPSFFIGRDTTCSVRLEDIYVARIHAEITFADGSWHLADCSSSNGTVLNGMNLVAGERYQLHAGDVIELAGGREKITVEDMVYTEPIPSGNEFSSALRSLSDCAELPEDMRPYPNNHIEKSCPRCGSWIPNGVEAYPQCGMPFRDESRYMECVYAPPEFYGRKKSDNGTEG